MYSSFFFLLTAAGYILHVTKIIKSIQWVVRGWGTPSQISATQYLHTRSAKTRAVLLQLLSTNLNSASEIRYS